MINVAELLKDCPRGMELDCLMYEDVCFDYVDELNIIHCYTHCQTHTTSLLFDQYGKPSSNIKSKCVIFPKGKTTWEGFVPPCKFKDGDIPKMYNTFRDGSFQHVEIIDEDYELALDKFDITTLKPFESRVLVRDNNCDEWEADIFGRYSDGYITLGGIKWKQCIPFEGNKHLLGTTDDCDKFFKF